MNTKTRVLLVEDHVALREGLRMLLEADGDIDVVAEAEGGKEAVDAATTHKPDVVLMDIALVGLDGIEATRRIVADRPSIGVLVLSARGELHVARAALDAGAIGYLNKRASGSELRDGVRAASKGQPYFNDETVRRLHAQRSGDRRRATPGAVRSRGSDEIPGRNADAPTDVLTQREVEVLQMIAAGHSNREIAEILKLSIKTIETHRMHLMEKLDIHDVSGLTRYAMRKGLIQA